MPAQAAKHIIYSSQLYTLENGQALLRYTGFKYPESQWAGLMDETCSFEARLTEIGHIILEAEASGPLYVLEQQLLMMARQHGANVVLIENLKSIEIKNKNVEKPRKRVQISGRCQRFDQ